MPMTGKGKKSISLLLVLTLFMGLLIGCSSSMTASPKVNDKLELAVKYLSENNYKEAILTYQSAIKIDSKNITAYKGLSLAYQLDNNMDLAEKTLDDGLKVVPQTTQLNLALAGLMLDQGKADKAEVIYKELVSADSPSLSAFQVYTYYLNKQGKQAEAIAQLELAAAKNSKEYNLNYMLAELYYKNGDQEKALAAIIKSLTSQFDQSGSYQLLAEMYQDKWADLIALGDQYIKQSQAQAGQLLRLSGLFNMGRYDDVIKQYGELTNDHKDNARTRLIAAQAYAKMSKKDQSSELLKPIKVAELKDAEMLAVLAAFYLETGDKENARKLAVQGISLDESIIDNYLVMYRSYEGEDQKLAQVWAYKYLLSSLLSYKESLNLLDREGINLEQSKDSVTSQLANQNSSKNNSEYLNRLIFRDIEGAKKDYENSHVRAFSRSFVVIDKDNYCYFAILYTPQALMHTNDNFVFGYIPTENDIWKNVIIQTKDFQIYDKQSAQKEFGKDLSYLRTDKVAKLGKEWYSAYSCNMSYADYLRKSGYNLESCIFVKK